MAQRELYNRGEHPWSGDWKKEKGNTVAIKIILVLYLIDLYGELSLRIASLFMSVSFICA